MIVTGWSNGRPNLATGSGYGLRIASRDRDVYFHRQWSQVALRLGGRESVQVTLSPSFWTGCGELRSRKIGLWMLESGLAPWPKGCPPRLRLEPTGEAEFRLTLA